MAQGSFHQGTKVRPQGTEDSELDMAVQIFSPQRKLNDEELVGQFNVRSLDPMTHLLAVITPEIMNRPRFQKFMHEGTHGTRIGLVVDDAPEKLTWLRVEPTVLSWLDEWEKTSTAPKGRAPALF